MWRYFNLAHLHVVDDRDLKIKKDDQNPKTRKQNTNSYRLASDPTGYWKEIIQGKRAKIVYHLELKSGVRIYFQLYRSQLLRKGF